MTTQTHKTTTVQTHEVQAEEVQVVEVTRPAGRPASELNTKVREALASSVEANGFFTIHDIVAETGADVMFVRRIKKLMEIEGVLSKDVFKKASMGGTGRPLSPKNIDMQAVILERVEENGTVSVPWLVENSTLEAGSPFCRRVIQQMIEAGELKEEHYQRVTAGGRSESETSLALREAAKEALVTNGEFSIKDMLSKVEKVSNQQCLIIINRLLESGEIVDSGRKLVQKGVAGRPATIYIAKS